MSFIHTLKIDELGWTAELKILISQLHFDKKEIQTRGFNVQRRHIKANAFSSWQYIDRNASGWVRRFGELHGIKGVQLHKQVEIQPYMVASTESLKKKLATHLGQY